jgi:metallo-beta-lactamase class B
MTSGLLLACAVGWVHAFAAGEGAGPAADLRPVMLGDDLALRGLAPGVWLHVSVKPDASGRPVEANGLLVATGESSILVDTGWTSDQARRLLDWAANVLRQPVRQLVVTHAHEDRMGGIAAALERQVGTHGHISTSRLARLYGGPGLQQTFEAIARLKVGSTVLELLYPGAGHAPDNIVVYLPQAQVLFAGCLVKPARARGIRDEDANLASWPLALRRIIDRFREVRVLVPGHGAPGGVELLSHTMDLLELEQARAPAPGRELVPIPPARTAPARGAGTEAPRPIRHSRNQP